MLKALIKSGILGIVCGLIWHLPASAAIEPTPTPTAVVAPAPGYTGQWDNLHLEHAFVKSNLTKPDRFVHYRNCAPAKANQMLWEAKLWIACPTDTLLVKVQAGKILWSVWNQSHPAIEGVLAQHKHAGSDQMVMSFTLTHNLQLFGLFMRPQGGNWMFINSPAMSVVVNKSETVEFYIMATDPNLADPALIDYPRGFDPMSMQIGMEWPDSMNCMRMSAVNFDNGEGIEMGGSSAPMRQFTMNKRIAGDQLTFAFNYGTSRAFGTWIITQELNNATNQWVTTDVNLVERSSITLPVNRRYMVLTMFDDPTACGETELIKDTNIATLQRVGLWPNH